MFGNLRSHHPPPQPGPEKRQGRLTEADVNATVTAEIRRALLEAGRRPTRGARLRRSGGEKAVDAARSGLNPGRQQVVKIVNEDFTEVLGGQTWEEIHWVADRPQ